MDTIILYIRTIYELIKSELKNFETKLNKSKIPELSNFNYPKITLYLIVSIEYFLYML